MGCVFSVVYGSSFQEFDDVLTFFRSHQDALSSGIFYMKVTRKNL